MFPLRPLWPPVESATADRTAGPHSPFPQLPPVERLRGNRGTRQTRENRRLVFCAYSRLFCGQLFFDRGSRGSHGYPGFLQEATEETEPRIPGVSFASWRLRVRQGFGNRRMRPASTRPATTWAVSLGRALDCSPPAFVSPCRCGSISEASGSASICVVCG